MRCSKTCHRICPPLRPPVPPPANPPEETAAGRSTPFAHTSSVKATTPTLELLRLGTHGVSFFDQESGLQKVGFLANRRYPPGYCVENQSDTDCPLPPREARAAANAAARANDLVAHGWNIEEIYDHDTDTTELQAQRLYASAAPARLPGTDMDLPRRISVLYEIGERSRNNGAPEAMQARRKSENRGCTTCRSCARMEA